LHSSKQEKDMTNKQTNSLPGNDEGDADKGTDTARVESKYGPPENRTLGVIFNRGKSVALDCAVELSEMIPKLRFDSYFGRYDYERQSADAGARPRQGAMRRARKYRVHQIDSQ
jgi:hypothetical protein